VLLHRLAIGLYGAPVVGFEGFKLPNQLGKGSGLSWPPQDANLDSRSTGNNMIARMTN
jgi:hypothetical protein